MTDTTQEPEPAGPARISAHQFLARCASTEGIHKYIDGVLRQAPADSPVTERLMLASCIGLLHAIGHSMPFDDQVGLDATRLTRRNGQDIEIVPPWREIIGVVLGVTFSRAPAASPDQGRPADGA